MRLSHQRNIQRRIMINQRHCPYCQTPAAKECSHLALAVEARDFVRRCIEICHGEGPWRVLCQQRQERERAVGGWSSNDDFTWLETAFCEEFLRNLKWFGTMDHEWRSGPKPEQGGFWVVLWSKEPRQLWWELREELDRRMNLPLQSKDSPPGLLWLTPR